MECAREFTLFPTLPKELRLKIWLLSIEAQIHKLRYDETTHTISSSSSPPDILRVCAESREAGLSVYKELSSPPHDDTPRHRFDHIRPFYICPDLDTLFLDYEILRQFSSTFFSRFQGSFISSAIEQGGLKKVAFDLRAWTWLYDWHSVKGVLRDDSWLRALKQLYFVTVMVNDQVCTENIASLKGTWRLGEDVQTVDWIPIMSATSSDADYLPKPLIAAVTLFCEKDNKDNSASRRPRTKDVGVVEKKSGPKKRVSRFLSWSYLDKKVKDSRFLSNATGSSHIRLHNDRGTGVYALGEDHISRAI